MRGAKRGAKEEKFVTLEMTSESAAATLCTEVLATKVDITCLISSHLQLAGWDGGDELREEIGPVNLVVRDVILDGLCEVGFELLVVVVSLGVGVDEGSPGALEEQLQLGGKETWVRVVEVADFEKLLLGEEVKNAFFTAKA